MLGATQLNGFMVRRNASKKISSHTYLGEDYIDAKRGTYIFDDASFDLGADSPYRGVIVIYNWQNNTTNSGTWCDIDPVGESAVRLTKQESATRSEAGVSIFFGMVPTGSTFKVKVFTSDSPSERPERASCCVYKVMLTSGVLVARDDQEDTISTGGYTSVTVISQPDDLIITGVVNENSTGALTPTNAGTEDLDIARTGRYRSGAYSVIETGTNRTIGITGNTNQAQIQVSAVFYAGEA